MYVDLEKHHTAYVLPIIQARMKVIKNRILKQKGDEWYDYDDEQINSKCRDLSDEYYRLDQSVDIILKAIEQHQQYTR
jgi:hypothetical protein